VPNLATRILHKAGYDGRAGGKMMARDVVSGCPGWLDALTLADLELKAGTAKRVAIIGAETLSRVRDPYHKDGLIFSDGAGAVILEAIEGPEREGILSWDRELITYFDPKGSDVTDPSQYLSMRPSKNPAHDQSKLYLDMMGPEVAQLAIVHVPRIMAAVLEKEHLGVQDVDLYLLHQANKKLDFDMARAAGIPEGDLEARVPITLDDLGNSSVATLPTMYDLIARRQLVNGNARHTFVPGSYLGFASVGADMCANAMLYKMPRQPYRT
jgi:3-oxoacyl-[acyl-carrier-protein] synthase III